MDADQGNAILVRSKDGLGRMSKWDEKVRLELETALSDADALHREVSALTMTEPGAAILAAEVLKRLQKTEKKFETGQEALLRPLNDDRNEIFAWFKPVVSATAGIISTLKGKIDTWRRAEEARLREAARLDAEQKERERAEARRLLEAEERRKAEERRALEDAARLEAEGKAKEAQELLELEMQTAAAPAPASAIAAAQLATVAPDPEATTFAPIKRIETSAGSVEFTDEVDFEVIDAWLIPREYVKPPEVKRGDLMKHLRLIAKFPAEWDKGIPGLKIVRKGGIR